MMGDMVICFEWEEMLPRLWVGIWESSLAFGPDQGETSNLILITRHLNFSIILDRVRILGESEREASRNRRPPKLQSIHRNMTDQTPSANSTINPYEYLQIVRNSDGTLTRLLPIPSTAATGNNGDQSPVISQDFPLNPNTNTWIRIFRPGQVPDSSSSSSSKLPLIIYFHGGGFILCSADSVMFHSFCSTMVTELSSLIVSVGYRLAPEHRLPAAYEDAVDAIHWIRDQSWLRDLADFSQCFLMGTSAGGNIAYHAGLRAAAAAPDDLEPLKIKGFILHQPFFGGSQRTGSELRLVNDPILPLCATDLMWDLGLPIGADRDHEYCNAMIGGGTAIEQIGLLGWRCLVTGCDGDPLVDRQIELVRRLEEKGVGVVSVFGEGGFHGVELFDPDKARALFLVVKDFIFSVVTA
ncbi:hypothetical protein HHK36_028800 [Tetracentron sinense]|uniref:Alpha/beta hydrolase fold-3 domain-containing protein n=1 Tax=Tetracentron sinense TaxID=13715 RepID=A0A834YG22_TETSI|nr:hypothetical protein HHK36_028800 [Tetracentron sinense]